MLELDTPDNGEEPFLEVLAARKSELSPSERRVADFVLQEPDKIIRMSIASLAETVGVSQPTVLRFVRAMGLASYPELKLRTGQSIVSGTPYVHSNVDSDDPLERIIDKVVDSSIYTLTAMRRSIDQVTLERVVDILTNAPRIDCYGTGAARILAMEAQHKLMRFGIPVVSYDDTHLQRLAAASLRPGDVALCFSHTGMVRDTEAMALKARECGAVVVSVTRPDTALSAASDIVLAIDAHENTEIYAPMLSRVAHAVLLDIITTAIALRGGPQMHEKLRAAKNSLADLRIQSKGAKG
ncbi:SIS domain-containing protein [Pelagibacterium sediminicola]|uniref:SIS domain-containing protein n=1 Tax=Pelagibacterium sediminicola TaxID=2248761 RepID=UPI000E32464E|nr:SIS domain-containing protein [Pelagibacterium sediminicola]